MWRSSPLAVAKVVEGARLAVGGSSAGTGAWVVLIHLGHGWVPTVAGAVIAVFGIACVSAPKIIRSRSEAKVAGIQASCDSEVEKLYAQTQAALLRLGADASKTEQVMRMLGYQLLHVKLSKSQPLGDEALVKLVKEILRAIEAPTANGSTNSSDSIAASANVETPAAVALGDSPTETNGVIVNIRPPED